MAGDEPDFLDEMIAKRAEANPDFPAMVEAVAAARAERRAKVEAASDITDEERGGGADPPS